MRGTLRNALVSPTAARDDAHTREFYGKGVSTLCVLTCLARTLPWPGARTDVARSSAARCCSLGGSKVPESASLECASPHQGSLFARFRSRSARAKGCQRPRGYPEATPICPARACPGQMHPVRWSRGPWRAAQRWCSAPADRFLEPMVLSVSPRRVFPGPTILIGLDDDL